MSQKMPFFKAEIQKMCAKNANMYRATTKGNCRFGYAKKIALNGTNPSRFTFFVKVAGHSKINNIGCIYFRHTNHHFSFEGGIKYVR